ncbi:MAG: lamin tail domain-containing protein, partial [Flavobacteriales bacterium]
MQAQVVVNEVCASNMNGYADNYGEFEDWFELYNTTGAAVDISGWWVSNRAGNPLKWQVPAGTTIPAGGRQVFICIKRHSFVCAFIHCSFNLNQAESDHVLLCNASGDPVAFAKVEAQYNWKSLVDYFCLNSYTVCADWLNWNTGWWRGLDPSG